MIELAACSLLHPWLRSNTKTPCLNIYAISSLDDKSLFQTLSTTPATSDKRKNSIENILKTAELTYNKMTQKIWPFIQPKNGDNEKKKYENYWKNWSEISKNLHANRKQEKSKLVQFLKYDIKNQWMVKDENDDTLTLSYGLYGAVILNPYPHYPEQRVAYNTFRYNPHLDMGKGNRLWIESITKDHCKIDQQVNCMIEDAPLWLASWGYADWCDKFLKHHSVHLNYRVCFRSPWTLPQAYDPQNPSKGWVILSENFMLGKMPGGEGYVPLDRRDKWYPILANQEEALEEIGASGPFAPRDHEYKSWDITLGYKFRFKLGGLLLHPKQIQDPCKRPTHDLPEPGGGGFLRDVQITDPRKIGDAYQFHPWDVRRGLFSFRSLKRIAEDETDDEGFQPLTKYPKTDPPTAGRGLAELCTSTLRGLLQESCPSPLAQISEIREERDEGETAETQEGLQQQLLQQLQLQREQQKLLRVGLRGLVQEMFKMQRGLGVDPYLR